MLSQNNLKININILDFLLIFVPLYIKISLEIYFNYIFSIILLKRFRKMD